jgi:transcriptional regulator with XRE-family HTH domain
VAARGAYAIRALPNLCTTRQEQLADISGFSQQYISGAERGHRNPTVVTVYELATALGVNYLDLMRPPPRGKR